MAKVLRTVRPLGLSPSLNLSSRRTFLNLASESQSLTESRVLPYSSSQLYKLIADIDNYRDFVPYCTNSRVTKWSAPDREGKKWPSEAELKVGWGGIEEAFTSRLFCDPGKVVEATSGGATSNLPKATIEHHKETMNAPPIHNSVFKSLTTTWSLKPFHYTPPVGNLKPGTNPSRIETEEAKDRTEVSLTIDYAFINPMYAAMSKAVAPKVAGVMIQAFENRAKMLLEGNGSGKAALKDTFRSQK